MRFATTIAGCVHGKWKLEYHVVWHFTPTGHGATYGKWYEKNYLHLIFTFYLNSDTSAPELFPVVVSKKKKIPLVDPFTCLLAMNRNRLELSDCGRKIRNDIHTDTYYCKPKLVSWRKLNITVFYTRFLSPTDRKYAESSTYSQFLDYRPPVNFDRYTYSKVWCKELDPWELDIYIYISPSR